MSSGSNDYKTFHQGFNAAAFFAIMIAWLNGAISGVTATILIVVGLAIYEYKYR